MRLSCRLCSCTACTGCPDPLGHWSTSATKGLNEDFSPFSLFPSLRFVNTTGSTTYAVHTHVHLLISTHTSQMWICSFAVSLNYSSWAKAMQLPTCFYHGHVCDRTIWTSDSHCSTVGGTPANRSLTYVNGFSLSTVATVGGTPAKSLT